MYTYFTDEEGKAKIKEQEIKNIQNGFISIDKEGFFNIKENFGIDYTCDNINDMCFPMFGRP